MVMQVAKRGARYSNVKVTINEKINTISFSAGFCRLHNINNNDAKYVKLGYDTESNEIGLSFIIKDDGSGEAMKLSYTKSGTAASCQIRSLLTTFMLDINQISGNYLPNAISGPIKIEGFATNGFILKVSMREP